VPMQHLVYVRRTGGGASAGPTVEVVPLDVA
jgi:hypothetical protein